MQNNNIMITDAQETLIEILNTDGIIASELFEELASEMLMTHHGYTEDDLNDMSVYDLQEKVGEIFMMVLKEDNDMYVNLVGYINK